MGIIHIEIDKTRAPAFARVAENEGGHRLIVGFDLALERKLAPGDAAAVALGSRLIECEPFEPAEETPAAPAALDDERTISALGWMHAELCARLDRDEDPRQVEVPELLALAWKAGLLTQPYGETDDEPPSTDGIEVTEHNKPAADPA